MYIRRVYAIPSLNKYSIYLEWLIMNSVKEHCISWSTTGADKPPVSFKAKQLRCLQSSGESTFIFADDTQPRGVTTLIIVDYMTIATGDKFGHHRESTRSKSFRSNRWWSYRCWGITRKEYPYGCPSQDRHTGPVLRWRYCNSITQRHGRTRGSLLNPSSWERRVSCLFCFQWGRQLCPNS